MIGRIIELTGQTAYLAFSWRVPDQREILTESNKVDGAQGAAAKANLCTYVCTRARETAHTTAYTNNLEERLTKSEN